MEQLQIFEMTAELDEQNSAIDENDEINENSEEETNKTTSSTRHTHSTLYILNYSIFFTKF